MVSNTCSVNGCGGGYIYCSSGGGVNINACCPNTQTCNAWFAAGGCGASQEEPDPDDPPDPTDPPPASCSPPSSGWNPPRYTFQQNPNGGPNWDASESRYFLRTNNNDGRITVEWNNPSNASQVNQIEYRFVPTDAAGTNVPDPNGQSGCNHRRARCGIIGGSTRELTFRPRDHRYYKLRIRFRNGCGSGSWSAWRDPTVRIDGQITGRVFFDNAGTATPTGLYNSCVGDTSSAVQNTTMTVTATNETYSNTDTSLNSSTARYRVYLPYINPGAVTLTLNNLPPGYVCSCPAGCQYNASNSTIPAPFLDNGTTGNMSNAHFFVCSAGSAPAAPTIVDPATEGATKDIFFSGGQYVTNLTFSKPPTANLDICIYRTALGHGGGDNCNTTNAVQLLNYAGTSYNFAPATTTNDWTVRVRSTATACSQNLTSSWVSRRFLVRTSVRGTVYEDLGNTAAGSFCSSGGGVTRLGTGGTSFSVGGVTMGTAGVTTSGPTAGDYVLYVPWGTATGNVSYSDGGATTCSCPAGCIQPTVNPNILPTGVNFYRSEVSDAWWQASGGPILALSSGGNVVRSYVPATATEPYLITAGNGAGASGYVVVGGEASEGAAADHVDLSSDAGNQAVGIDEAGLDIVARAVPTQETFDTFVRRYKLPFNRQDDFDGSVAPVRPSDFDAFKPTHTPLNGVAAYWSEGDLTITGGSWSVGAGETVVIFVDGSLNVNTVTNVAPGGFLAFIVSGDIWIDAEVGNASAASTDGVVEGMYLADGVIIVEGRAPGGGSDLKFVGEGSFIGWSGIQLERDFSDGGVGGADNNLYPTELFVYRPDLLLNAPVQMRRPQYVWREVAP